MELKISDNVTVNATEDEVSAFLADIESVSSCIPDSKNFRRWSDNEFDIEAEVGMAQIRGTFLVSGSLAKSDKRNFRYTLEAHGLGSKAHIELGLKVSPAGSGSASVIEWDADANLSGIISGVNEQILVRFSQDKISQIIQNLKTRLEGRHAG